MGEGLSALRSAAGNHLAPVAVGHPFPKAVLLFTVQFFRLIGSFHLWLNSIPSANLKIMPSECKFRRAETGETAMFARTFRVKGCPTPPPTASGIFKDIPYQSTIIQ